MALPKSAISANILHALTQPEGTNVLRKLQPTYRGRALAITIMADTYILEQHSWRNSTADGIPTTFKWRKGLVAMSWCVIIQAFCHIMRTWRSCSPIETQPETGVHSPIILNTAFNTPLPFPWFCNPRPTVYKETPPKRGMRPIVTLQHGFHTLSWLSVDLYGPSPSWTVA